MRRTALALLSAFFLVVLSGLTVAQPRVAPPPPRVEAPTLQPSPGHVWITGYWRWTGVNYEWNDGRWIKAKKGRVWVAGTWERVGNRWHWKPGKWVKTGRLKMNAGKPPEKPGKAGTGR